MTTFNYTRTGTRNQKKDVGIAHAKITFAEFVASLDVSELVEMPKNAFVTAVHLNVTTAFTGGSSSAATLTIKLDATTLVAAISVFTAGVKTLTVTKQDTGGAGAQLLALATYTAGVPTVGEADLIVEYVEYNKVNGELTDYSATA